jgi:hypothetical protein
VITPDIGDVLDEEHDEDVVLVFGRIDGAAEGVTGFPEDVVDLLLGDGSMVGREGGVGLEVRFGAVGFGHEEDTSKDGIIIVYTKLGDESCG